MDLHEDEVPRSGVIIDVDIDGGGGDYSIIRLNGDVAMGDWGTRGAGSSKWKLEREDGGPTNPWRVFMDFLYRALGDAGYDPRPLTDPNDPYGPLGISSKARQDSYRKSGEVPEGGMKEEDLLEMEVECNSLGADPMEASQTLLSILNDAPDIPEGFSFKMDDNVGEPTIYGTLQSIEPGYQVGELDIGTFETNERGPEVDAAREELGGKEVIDTDTMDPKDIRQRVRGSYRNWKGRLGGGEIERGDRVSEVNPSRLSDDSDSEDVKRLPMGDPEDFDSADDIDFRTRRGGGLEEARGLCADPNVYASALLLSGFTPMAVHKILGSQGLKTSMSEEEMSQVRALHSAVISESLADHVSKAHRAIRLGGISRNGMLREDLVERCRRILFTKRFAQGFVENSERLEPFLTFKEQIEFHLTRLKVSEVPGQAISNDVARKIVGSLNEQELDTIRANIGGISNAPMTDDSNRQSWPHTSDNECPMCMGEVDPLTKQPCGNDPCDCYAEASVFEAKSGSRSAVWELRCKHCNYRKSIGSGRRGSDKYEPCPKCPKCGKEAIIGNRDGGEKNSMSEARITRRGVGQYEGAVVSAEIDMRMGLRAVRDLYEEMARVARGLGGNSQSPYSFENVFSPPSAEHPNGSYTSREFTNMKGDDRSLPPIGRGRTTSYQAFAFDFDDANKAVRFAKIVKEMDGIESIEIDG